MQLPKIRCYNGTTPENGFYVLSKGENAGKPLRTPCPNCFTLSCASAEEKEYWYWLCWGLWSSKVFHGHLVGSVVPFIRLSELQLVLIESSLTTFEQPETLSKAIKTMQDIERYEQQSKQKLALLAQLKITVFRKVLSRV